MGQRELRNSRFLAMAAIFLALAVQLVIPCPASAQNVGQPLVLTWENGATIQLLVKPDGTQLFNTSPPEPISGGLTAVFVASPGTAYTEWNVRDLRLQSKNWTISYSDGDATTNWCGFYRLGIADQAALPKQVYTFWNVAQGAGDSLSPYPCLSEGQAHSLVVTSTSFNPNQYRGFFSLNASPFEGTVLDPLRVPSIDTFIAFGPPGPSGTPQGLAFMRGTFRIEAGPLALNTPTHLQAVVGDRSVLLTWDPVIPQQCCVDHYRVFVLQLDPLGAVTGLTSPSAALRILSMTNNYVYRITVSVVVNGTEGPRSAPIFVIPNRLSFTAPEPRPILFLHGFQGTANTFADSVSYMSSTLGWRSGGVLIGSTPPSDPNGTLFTSEFANSTGGLVGWGDEVKRWVTTLNHRGNGVTVVAHSNGGLAARASLTVLQGSAGLPADVRTLVTYGTPHRGADVDGLVLRLRLYGFFWGPIWGADLNVFLDALENTQGAKDARFQCQDSEAIYPDSQIFLPFPWGLTGLPLAPSVRYVSIFSHYHMDFPFLSHRGLLDDCHSRHWDGLVPTDSANLSTDPAASGRAVVQIETDRFHAGQGSDVVPLLCALSTNCSVFQAHSPVDIEVEDPLGERIGPTLVGIPAARYAEIPTDTGDEDAHVYIPFPLAGTYTVRAIPKEGALPTDRFSIDVTQKGVTTVLAENMLIADIPEEGFTAAISPTIVIRDCETGVPNQKVDGSPISDKIEACRVAAKNKGAFVSCVSNVTNDLKKRDLITGAQKGAIQSCAANGF